MNNKISSLLYELLAIDWNKIDNLEMIEQVNEIKRIHKQFKKIIKLESKKNDFNYDSIHQFLNIYHEKNSKNIFIGKNKLFVNSFLLTSQLRDILRKIEFNEFKKITNYPKCECAIRNKFKIDPKHKYLNEIGCNFDGYYDTYIYKCSNCGFEWMVTLDDENGLGYYKPWNKMDYPINNKNCS
ncbi:hypothetical protein [Winogradskyella sp.]|uniref:hypothetical protein n=1 Tax=Winogradskyella sp. TaxID=1883156 RepID=UPI003BA98D16